MQSDLLCTSYPQVVLVTMRQGAMLAMLSLLCTAILQVGPDVLLFVCHAKGSAQDGSHCVIGVCRS